MEKWEKAVAGLGRHIAKECKGCSYSDVPSGCIDRLMEDAMNVILRYVRMEDAIRRYLDGMKTETQEGQADD